MCITPITLDSGDTVACRNCWQCRGNRVNDYVGRCIAEQLSAKQTLAVTLTYAGDGPETATLVYKDFQDFMKRLRKKFDGVRYIVAGEYGSKKGRAHWHAVLFFHGEHPRIVDNPDDREPWEVILPRWEDDAAARINWKAWPQGFSYFQEPSYEGFRYLMKYVLKDQDQRSAHNHLAMSKQPPLGTQFFLDRAERYVEQGLAPQSFEYWFDDVFDANRKRRKFWLQGKTRENFLDHFLSKWREKYERPHPFSELLYDKLAKETADDDQLSENAFAVDLERKRRDRMFDLSIAKYRKKDGVERLGRISGVPVEWRDNRDGSVTISTGEKVWTTWHVDQEDEKAKLRARFTAARTRGEEQSIHDELSRLVNPWEVVDWSKNSPQEKPFDPFAP